MVGLVTSAFKDGFDMLLIEPYQLKRLINVWLPLQRFLTDLACKTWDIDS